jgi:cob(I)alamin adenosyltransferase
VALPVREGAFMSNEQDKKQQAHQKKMEALKENIDASIEAATIDRGVGILLTGNGKGKSSSAFGMVMRALGYEYKVGVVQFIKGQQLSGEEIYVREQCPSVTFHQMNTGFTWDTQDRSSDIVAAKTSWAIAEKMLKDDSYHLVVLDELTYMISFDYLDEDSILSALKNRPENQSVVVTGRGGGSALTEWADTVSEIKEIKHAYNEGVMARKGVDL